MKSRSRTRSKLKIPNRIKSLSLSRRQTILVLSLLAGTFLAICLVLLKLNDSKHSVPLGKSIEGSAKSIRVESSIPGIVVKGSPFCDSANLGRHTPYNCGLQNDQNKTTLTAPQEVTIDGQTYVFKTWDGCSESNDDKKVCKIEIANNQVKTAKASYVKKERTSSASNDPPSSLRANGSCRIATKYIIAGPQSFDPAKPSQIIIYNSTRNPYQPTYIQVWNGDACKDVVPNNELRATDSGYGHDVLAWGLTTSPRPKDIHAYIGLIDNGRTQHPQLIIREDGLITADEERLEQKLSIASGVNWRLEAWLDSKTMLLHVFNDPDHIGSNANYSDFDNNPANWFYYNVETDSFINKLPPNPIYYID